ncbi:putative MATE efflux family protein 6-like [Capsicum annuum]|nr:putative MATE efflux family protein 6-like [Capsicum annuum]
MAVKMMKWMSCSPLLSSKKYEAKITVNCLKGFNFLLNDKMGVQDFDRLRVEIKWKGSSKGVSLNLGSFNRRSVKNSYTKEECLMEDEGIGEWYEEFLSVCKFSGWKDGVFQPWEVVFTVINGTSKGPNQKVPVLSSATLNLADFASVAGDKQEGIEIFIPLEVSVGSFKSYLSLCLVVNLVELRNTHEASETFSKFVMSTPVYSNPGKALLTDKNGGGSLKASLRKVKFLKALSFRLHKKAYHAEEGSSSDGRNSVRSKDPDYVYPVDTDSLDEDSVGEFEEGNEDTSVQKSFSYEAPVYANHAGGSFCSNTSGSSSDEDLVHYSHHISDTKHKYPEDNTTANQSAKQSSKRSLLSWRKRKLSFKYPKTKGEPFLKKHYGEDGADDIDFDRRQLCSSDKSSRFMLGHKSDETSPILVSEFGDKSFIVGESVCTALVAVIADWFHCNSEDMPIKYQLDSLICEGSMPWRDLCENETYRERFLDKYFDLEIVFEAKVFPLSVVSEKSFIGLFHPEGIEEEKGFHFLHGSMSFDNIWDEISKSAQETPRNGDSCVYIVSWNDHFFILKVEKDAYYIIDTLRERLFEGCNQAYILKFYQDTTIMKAPSESQQSDDKPSCDRKEKTDVKEAADESNIVMSTNSDDSMQEDRIPEKNIIYRDKEACKELNVLPRPPDALGTSKGPNQKVPVLYSATLNLADFVSVAGDKQEGIEIFVPLEVSIGSFKSCLSLCVRETKTHVPFICFNFLLNEKMGVQDFDRLRVEIKWKGSSKGISLNLGSFNRRSVKKNFTKEECLKEDEGIVEWNEKFLSVCKFSGWKDGVFQPWEVVFTVINAQRLAATSRCTGTTLALAACCFDCFEPIVHDNRVFSNPQLVLNLMELRNTHEASETFLKFIMSAPVSPNPGKALFTDRNGGSSLKAEEGNSSDGRNSVRSEDPDYVYLVDTDSLDEDSIGESEEEKKDTSVQKSFSYEALVYANHAGGSFCSNTSGSSSDEDLFHYSHHISDTKHKYHKDKTVANQSTEQSSKHSLLSWRKKKLSFKYPKTKGEPLLKKHYGEDSADDIGFDRRLLCSSDESSSRGNKSKETSPISISEFGDESFAVDETYREHFPDKHFDHETVLEAKVEKDAYYIIDTLGERLFEGCNQAYILKFDHDTTIMQAPGESQQSDDKPSCDRKEKTDVKEAADESKIVMSTNSDDSMQEDRVPEKNIIYRGVHKIKPWKQPLPEMQGWKDGVFQPLEVVFTVINALRLAATSRFTDFASVAGDKQEGIEILVPLEVSVGSFKSCLSLCLVLSLVELRNTHEASETFSKFIMSTPVSSNPGKALLTDRNGGGSLKADLRKVKFFKAISFRRHKKAYYAEEDSSSDRKNSVRSEDPDYVYPVDTDSLDEDSVGESKEGNEDTSVQKSFSYEAPVYVNHAGGLFCSNTSGSSSDEDLVHYGHHISDTKHKYPEDKTATNQSAEQSSKCSLLSWRKRKLSFKYPKTKGEPLLKKHYGEDGANDIGFDRRQLCSSNESSSRGHKSEETSLISVSEFGDESFAVGSWE